MARLRIVIAGCLLLLAAVPHSYGQQLYIANEPQKQLQLLDLTTAQLTVLYNIGAKPDDLVVNSQGQLIYSVPSLGTVSLFDPVAMTNTVLATGLKFARDLIIEPGGTTMLISVCAKGMIVRYDFVTGTTTVLAKKLGKVDGLAYDPAGELFAVARYNTIVQIDPVTGAVLKTLVLEPHQGVNGGDGMTYDSFTGQLWLSHGGAGKGLIAVPTDLSGFTFYQTGNIPSPDGIKSDGNGNLYIGAIHRVWVYNIPTDTITASYVVKGADGIALVPGTY